MVAEVKWFCPTCQKWVKEPISKRCKKCDKEIKEKSLAHLKHINSTE